MGTRNHRNRHDRTPLAAWRRLDDTKRAVILLIAGILACVAMLALNPFQHNESTTASTQTSASTPSKNETKKPSTKTMPKDQTDQQEEDEQASSDDPGFDGDTDAIGAKVQELLDSPADGSVDSLSTLLYRYGDKELADGRQVFESIGAGETRPRVLVQARDWWSKASKVGAAARLKDLKASTPGALEAASNAARLDGGTPKACATLAPTARKAQQLVDKGAKATYEELTDMQGQLDTAIQSCTQGMDADTVTKVFGQQQGTTDATTPADGAQDGEGK
ncbi:hypothetical protein CSQ85_09100 [Bifidobacterium rousetti]|uniref:hypothetical protein n=1 Tax=Bifidobacterium rousetti TaxID=2045439 RepID=UPI001239974B|nr:hypothetical protein [Bifidobacterium rousetti]KAA8818308.1 hypothetical protein CSQ85_09100 [Bifidobacterium rousetti]